MAYRRRILLVPLLLVGLAAAAGARPTDPPPRSDAGWAREKLFGWWEEIEVVEAGVKPPTRHEWEAYKLTRTEVRTVTLHGQCEIDTFRNGLRIDTTTTPWRLDFVNDEELSTQGHRCILTGIFRFEGEHLVWVTEGGCRPVKPGVEPAANDPHRPTDFTSTRENRQTRTVFKRVTNEWYTD